MRYTKMLVLDANKIVNKNKLAVAYMLCDNGFNQFNGYKVVGNKLFIWDVKPIYVYNTCKAMQEEIKNGKIYD